MVYCSKVKVAFLLVAESYYISYVERFSVNAYLVKTLDSHGASLLIYAGVLVNCYSIVARGRGGKRTVSAISLRHVELYTVYSVSVPTLSQQSNMSQNRKKQQQQLRTVFVDLSVFFFFKNRLEIRK